MKRFLIIAALLLPLAVDAAWLTGWSHRAAITIDATEVDEAVPYIYVPLAGFDSTWWDAANSIDGRDIRVTEEDGETERACYVFGYVNNEDGTGTGGLLINTASYLSTSSDIAPYVYVGNVGASMPAAGDTYGRNAVFDAGTEAYYLLNSLTDLTGNGNDLTAYNTPTANQSSNIEGLESYLFDDASNEYALGAISITAWPVSIESINSPDTESGQWATTTLGDSTDNVDRLRIVAVGDAPNDPYFAYSLGSTGSSITISGTVVNYAANSWYHAALVQKSSSGTTLYVNGGVEGTSATSVTNPSFNQVGIGINASNTLDKPFSGKISMSAVHTVERSTNYWSTVNSYWFDPSFSTHGASEAEPSGGDPYETTRGFFILAR